MAGVTLNRQRILLVEDEELVSNTLSKMLDRRGFDVTIAGTLGRAIDAIDSCANETPFQHIVLDLCLPDGDGESLLDVCDQFEPRPSVIVVAAPENVDCRRMASFRGRCDYLPKPLIFEMLLDLLERRPSAWLCAYADKHSLSRQELAVLAAAIEGLEQSAIARQIGCKASTVRTYWARILEKTDTSGREQVLAHVIRWLAHGGRVAANLAGREQAKEPAPMTQNVLELRRG